LRKEKEEEKEKEEKKETEKERVKEKEKGRPFCSALLLSRNVVKPFVVSLPASSAQSSWEAGFCWRMCAYVLYGS
jgi:hypothetical protein